MFDDDSSKQNSCWASHDAKSKLIINLLALRQASLNEELTVAHIAVSEA